MPSINWSTGVISVPLSDLTALGGGRFGHDLNAFRLALKDLEDDEAGIVYPATHNHNTEVLLSGVTYSRTLEILSPYTVEYEDGSYRVVPSNANHNIADVMVVNQVSIEIGNSAGLQTVAVGSGVLPSDVSDIATATRNAILSDQTPFDGAFIDAAISSITGGGGSITPADKAEIATLVASRLAAAHGTRSWETDNGGFPITVDQEAKIYFPLFQADGVTPETGRTNGEFTKTLTVNGASSANVVTVTEVGAAPGNYEIAFTPTAEGTWYVRIDAPLDQVFAYNVIASYNITANSNVGGV